MGNFSRDTFKINELKHYSGVRLQQGVPLVDADWNEMEDIRKFEFQDVLKWFVGNGVPKGNDGFHILPIPANDDFLIKGGDGTVMGAGRCLVDGHEVMVNEDINYKDQPLYDNNDLAAEWGVEPLGPLDPPPGPGAVAVKRGDKVYLDVWEREVNAKEDGDLVNPAIGIETCMRIKREWVVRVKTDIPFPPPQGHVFYLLAILVRNQGESAIDEIKDWRTTNVNLMYLTREIMDARGIKGNLGNRLDESLTKGGQLRDSVVDENQLVSDLRNKIGRPIGWLRLTFLPKKYGDYAEFTNFYTYAFCDSTGAKGNMEIPVPPGATKINRFRIHGDENEDKIKLVVGRSLWDGSNSSWESLLTQEFTDAPFNELWSINKSINPETESISLYVEATKVARIYTVAFEFE